LTDAAARRDGVFVAEGVLVIRQLLASPYRVRSILVTPGRLADFDGVPGLDAPIYVADQAVMNRIAGFDIHRGAVAAGERGPGLELSAVLASAERLLVLEGLTDGENVGALFRNAAAFGVDAVLLCPRCCDPLYRRAIRVSIGESVTRAARPRSGQEREAQRPPPGGGRRRASTT